MLLDDTGKKRSVYDEGAFAEVVLRVKQKSRNQNKCPMCDKGIIFVKGNIAMCLMCGFVPSDEDFTE